MRLPAVLVPVLVLAHAFPAAAQNASRGEIDRAIAAVYPSLVRVAVVTASFSGGREIRSEAFGSGTIVSQDGYVVTNHHVAGHARRVVCTLATQEEVPADLVGTDALTDITVLKLRPSTPRKFPVAVFVTSKNLARGDTVLALGSPLALSQSVTQGIVSNVEMVMPRAMAANFSLDGEDVGSIVRWIGHDAAIYPGNSGGPLVNLKGEIVGVNELSYGLAGAIPSDVVKPVAAALMSEGRVRRASLGLDLQPRLNRDHRKGVLVASIDDGSPAAAAGIRSGDLIVAIDGAAVDVQFPEQLPLVNQIIASLTPGKSVPIEVIQGAGKPSTIDVTPIERGPVDGDPIELREWGIVASSLTASSVREMGRASVAGARVNNVRAGGAAQQAKPPIEADDVIVEVEGKPVRTAADLRTMTETAMATSGRASLLVAFDRRDERRLTVVELSAPRADDPPLEARKAWLAITYQILTPPLAQRLGLAGRTGVRVTRVVDPSVPLRVGDVILAIDGTPVRASAPGDEQVFNTMMRQYPTTASVPLTVYRDGAEIAVTATVKPAPRQPREMRRYEAGEFGLRVRELSDEDRDDPRLKGLGQGVVVDAVEPGGWAALARLNTGDVIMTIEGQPVPDVEAFTALVKAATAARQSSVVMRVRRGVRTLFVEIEPSWPK